MLQGFTMQKIDALAVLSFFTCFLLSVVSVPFEDTLYFADRARAGVVAFGAGELETLSTAAVVSRRERREVHLRYHRVVLRVLHRHTRGVGRGGARGLADARGAGSAVEKGADGVDAGESGAPRPRRGGGRARRDPTASGAVGTRARGWDGETRDGRRERGIGAASTAPRSLTRLPFLRTVGRGERVTRVYARPRVQSLVSRARRTRTSTRDASPFYTVVFPSFAVQRSKRGGEDCRRRRNAVGFEARRPGSISEPNPSPSIPEPKP